MDFYETCNHAWDNTVYRHVRSSQSVVGHRSCHLSAEDKELDVEKRHDASRCANIRQGGMELHTLLKETNRKLKVSAGLPEWKNYVEFVNSLVRQSITPSFEALHPAGAIHLALNSVEKCGVRMSLFGVFDVVAFAHDGFLPFPLLRWSKDWSRS